MIRSWKEKKLRTDKGGYVQCSSTWKEIWQETDWNYRVNLTNAPLIGKLEIACKFMNYYFSIKSLFIFALFRSQEKTGISAKKYVMKKSIYQILPIYVC